MLTVTIRVEMYRHLMHQSYVGLYGHKSLLDFKVVDKCVTVDFKRKLNDWKLIFAY